MVVKMKKIILLGWVCVLLFSCDDPAIFPIPGQPAGEETYGWFSASLVVNYMRPDYRRLMIDSCVHVNSFPLTDVTLTLTFPPQVEIAEGVVKWHGDITPKSDRCLHVIIDSKTYIKDWAHPIRTHVEGLYKGMRVSEDRSWGYDDYVKRQKTTREYEERQKIRAEQGIWKWLCRFWN